MNELDNADAYLVDSVEISRAIGNRPLFARTLLLQGEIAALKNFHHDAIVLSRSALEEFHDIEGNEGIASVQAILLENVTGCFRITSPHSG